MITRQDFIEKLEEWLTEETCNKLADIAEEHFMNQGFFSCYEYLLYSMYGYDADGIIDNLKELSGSELEFSPEDDFEGMAKFMETEW